MIVDCCLLFVVYCCLFVVCCCLAFVVCCLLVSGVCPRSLAGGWGNLRVRGVGWAGLV